MRRPQPAIGL
jgi:hypothetical protein